METEIELMRGKRVLEPSAYDKYSELRAFIEAELKILRAKGFTGAIRFVVQLRPAFRNMGYCIWQGGGRSELAVRPFMIAGKGKPPTERTLDDIRYTILHELGHWHHFVLYPESLHWKERWMENYANSFATNRKDPSWTFVQARWFRQVRVNMNASPLNTQG